MPVEIWRNANVKTLRVKIGEMPDDRMQASNKKTIKESANRIGLVLKEATAKDKKMLDGRNGLVVTKALALLFIADKGRRYHFGTQ